MSEPDRGLVLALMLARAGEAGLSVEAMLDKVGGSRSSLYHQLDRIREAGWPVATTMVGRSVTYRLAGGLALRKAPTTRPVRDQIESLALCGLGLVAIADALGVPQQSVSAVMKRMQAEGRLEPKKAAIRIVEELAKTGLSAAEIAEATGMTLEKVNNQLWKLRHSGLLPKVNRRQLVEGSVAQQVHAMILEGVARDEIARRIGTSLSTVHATVSRLRRDGHLPEGDATP